MQSQRNWAHFIVADVQQFGAIPEESYVARKPCPSICTIDTVWQLEGLTLLNCVMITFGVGKNFRFFAAQVLGPDNSLPMFHAFTGCAIPGWFVELVYSCQGTKCRSHLQDKRFSAHVNLALMNTTSY